MGAIKREEEWSGAAFVGNVDEGGPDSGHILGEEVFGALWRGWG